MNSIINQLKQYDFFKNKEFSITGIQDYGRKSKFKIKMDQKYYTVIIKQERILPYIKKFSILKKPFKILVGFQYLSNDNKVLVLDYYGNNQGVDLIKLEHENYDLENPSFYLELKEIIDKLHSHKAEYIDFSDNKYQSWKDYYLDEISEKIYSICEQNLISENTKKALLDKLTESSKIYNNNYKMTFIHADLTPLNVCINKNTKSIYLIDYDDFKIGDPLMDISRIINFKNTSKIFSKLVKNYYSQYENNINHLFYTLRVNVNWYNHILKRNLEDLYDLNQAKEEIYDTINRIIKNC